MKTSTPIFLHALSSGFVCYLHCHCWCDWHLWIDLCNVLPF